MLDFLSDGVTTLIDFFFWGAFAGAVGHAYYLLVRGMEKGADGGTWMEAIAGVLLSSLMGGLFAVVFDRAIPVSIMVGAFTYFIFRSFLKAFQNDSVSSAIREVLIKLLGGGK